MAGSARSRQKAEGSRGSRARKGRLLRAAFCLLPAAFCLLGPAGCATEQRPAAPAVDPLLGGPPLRPAPATPGSQAAAQPPTAPGPAPLPAPSSATSTAALAQGAFQPLDPNHDLRIGGPTAQPTGNSAGGTWRGQSAPTDVALQRPEPTAETPPAQRLQPQPGPTAQPTCVCPPPAAAARVATFEQAQVLLRAHGVTWQRLETGGDAGEWKFSCSIPSRQNPNIRQSYEARANDQVAALRAVLEQMEREQR
jgi:hypothetical protein